MIKLVIFDVDGTLLRGAEPIPHAAEAVRCARDHGCQVAIFTNNSGITAAGLAAKLVAAGIDVDALECYGAGPLAVQYCQEHGLQRVLVVGEKPLKDAFDQAGILSAETPDAVVAGIDREFTYAKCDAALQAIRGGASFIATNTDATYPLPGGAEQPGAGAIVASIQAASGVEPLILGKPSPRGFQMILAQHGIEPEEVLVVGDRWETDGLAGEALGAKVLMVRTGAALPDGMAAADDLRDFRNWLD